MYTPPHKKRSAKRSETKKSMYPLFGYMDFLHSMALYGLYFRSSFYGAQQRGVVRVFQRSADRQTVGKPRHLHAQRL